MKNITYCMQPLENAALTNYHAHTTFCDGADTPQATAEAAASKGFTVFGFSAHAMHPFSSEWHMPNREYLSYIKTIRSLADQYKDTLRILCGFEADYFPLLSISDFSVYSAFEPDFLIGSVHFLFNPDKNTPMSGNGFPYSCFTADGSAEEIQTGINSVFDGNAKKAVMTYFDLQREMIKTCSFNIVGHIDVIRKRNGVLHFFDESETWYKKEMTATAQVLAQTDKIVEINTGGMARGAIIDTYPSADFLSILHAHDIPVMINSDSHSAAGIDYAFDYAKKKAKDAGYTSFAVL